MFLRRISYNPCSHSSILFAAPHPSVFNSLFSNLDHECNFLFCVRFLCSICTLSNNFYFSIFPQCWNRHPQEWVHACSSCILWFLCLWPDSTTKGHQPHCIPTCVSSTSSWSFDSHRSPSCNFYMFGFWGPFYCLSSISTSWSSISYFQFVQWPVSDFAFPQDSGQEAPYSFPTDPELNFYSVHGRPSIDSTNFWIFYRSSWPFQIKCTNHPECLKAWRITEYLPKWVLHFQLQDLW